MQITPIASPSIPHPSGTSAQIQVDARTRAIQKLMDSPVQNPTQVAPEEMTAILPPQPVAPIPEQISSTEATAPIQEATTRLSPQYNALARKERALQTHAQKLRAERETFKAEAAAFQQMRSQYISKDELAKDPYGVILQNGGTYDQIVNQALNQPSAEEQAFTKYKLEMDAKLQRIEEQQQQSQKAMEEAQARSYDQAVAQIKTEVRHLVNNDPTFETVKAMGQSHEVTNLIIETFNKGLNRDYPKGSILPIEVAAQLVEDHLTEEAMKLSQIKKIQSRWSAQYQKQQQQVTSPLAASLKAHRDAPQPAPMRTLTNATSTQRPLSMRERAILAFKGELK